MTFVRVVPRKCFSWLVSVTVFTVTNCEWIQIPQTTSSVSKHELTIEHSTVLSDIYSKKDIDNLKYEDLEEIIGPDFEKHFRKYLAEHKNDMPELKNTSSGRWIGGDRSTSKFRNTSNEVGLNRMLYVDPWSSATTFHTSDKRHSISNKHWKDDFKMISPKRYLNESYMTPGDQHSNEEPATTPNWIQNQMKVDDKLEMGEDSSPEKEYTVRPEFVQAQSTTTETEIEADIDTAPDNVVLQVVKVKRPPVLSFSSFVQFLRDVQKTFVLNSKGIKDKIKLLEKFRDQIVSNIHERFIALWPSKPTEESKKRTKRGFMDGGHSQGMDFPSSEAALMTICFLTFAVFLIKLVLQVINTIKSKHYSFNSFETVSTSQANTSPIKIIKGNRNARKLSMTPSDVENVL